MPQARGSVVRRGHRGAARRQSPGSSRPTSTRSGPWVTRPNGGYLLALLGRAARHVAGGPDGTWEVVSASITYLRPPSLGPARIRTEVLRSGRTAAQVRCRAGRGRAGPRRCGAGPGRPARRRPALRRRPSPAGAPARAVRPARTEPARRHPRRDPRHPRFPAGPRHGALRPGADGRHRWPSCGAGPVSSTAASPMRSRSSSRPTPVPRPPS